MCTLFNYLWINVGHIALAMAWYDVMVFDSCYCFICDCAEVITCFILKGFCCYLVLCFLVRIHVTCVFISLAFCPPFSVLFSLQLPSCVTPAANYLKPPSSAPICHIQYFSLCAISPPICNGFLVWVLVLPPCFWTFGGLLPVSQPLNLLYPTQNMIELSPYPCLQYYWHTGKKVVGAVYPPIIKRMHASPSICQGTCNTWPSVIEVKSLI